VRLLVLLVNLVLIVVLALVSWHFWLGDFFKEVVTIKREDPSRYVPKNTRPPTLPSSFYEAVKMLARVPTATQPTITEEEPTPIRSAVLGVIYQFLGVLYDRENPENSGIFVVARMRDQSGTRFVGVFYKVGDLIVSNPKIWLASVVEKVPNLRYDFIFKDEKGKTSTIPLSLE